MQYFKTDIFTKIILILLLINAAVSWLMPKEKQVNLEQEIELHDIRKAREIAEKKSNEKDSIINLLFKKHEETKSDIRIDTASISDLDSMFTNYFKRK
jgi:hypothetical protein